MKIDMKKGCEIKMLGEVCDLSVGGDVPKDNFSEFQTDEHQIPIYANGEKNNGLYGYTSIAKITRPSITVSARGTIGFSVKRLESFYPIVRLISITPKDLHSLDLSFLDYAIKSIDFKHSGSSIPQLTVPMIRDYEIPLPPHLEQQRIVSILDAAFADIAVAKANAEQNLKNAKELFESYLQGVFSIKNLNWKEKCLVELGVITSSKRIYKSEYVNEGIPFYRTKEIKELSNGKDITLELFISKERYNEIKNTFGVPQINDLLMSAVGTIGEIMVVENENEFYFKDGNIVWLKDFNSLDTNYLKYALTAFVEKIKSLAIGAAYSALTIEKLNKYKISYPEDKSEQKTIVQKLDALSAETNRLEAIYQQKSLDLDELKKSVLQKAFNGEL